MRSLSILMLAILLAGCTQGATSSNGGSIPSTPSRDDSKLMPQEVLNKSVDYGADKTGADKIFSFAVPSGAAGLTFNVTWVPRTAAAPMTNITAHLFDPTGQVAAKCDLLYGVITQTNRCSRDVPATPGDWKLVTGGYSEIDALMTVRSR